MLQATAQALVELGIACRAALGGNAALIMLCATARRARICDVEGILLQNVRSHEAGRDNQPQNSQYDRASHHAGLQFHPVRDKDYNGGAPAAKLVLVGITPVS